MSAACPQHAGLARGREIVLLESAPSCPNVSATWHSDPIIDFEVSVKASALGLGFAPTRSGNILHVSPSISHAHAGIPLFCHGRAYCTGSLAATVGQSWSN